MIKNYQILINRKVEYDLEEIFNYLSEQNIIIASELLSGIKSSINLLSIFPERFAVIPEKIKINNFFVRHYIYKKSFRIIYIVYTNHVEVLSIRHGSLEPIKLN